MEDFELRNCHRSKSITRKSGSRSDNDDVPALEKEKVMFLVLRTLPDVKSVFRCKLVCKTWSKLISSPRFIRSFLNYHHQPHDLHKMINDNEMLHFVPQYPKKKQLQHFPVFLIDHQLALRNNDNNSFKFSDVKVMASYNDLLLCRLGKTDYCICNPLTKHYAILPPTNPIRNFPVVGFVCDSTFLSCKKKKKKKKIMNGEEHHVTINPDYNFMIVFAYNPRETKDNFDNDPEDKIIVSQFSSLTNKWHQVDLPGQYPHVVVSTFKRTDRMIFHKGMGFWVNSHSHISVYNPQEIENPTLHTVRTIRPPPVVARGSYITKPVIEVHQGLLRCFHLTDSSFIKGVEPVEVVNVIAYVWDLNGDYLNNKGEWSLVHTVSLDQLGAHWHLGVSWERKLGTVFDFDAVAINPNDGDIVYIATKGNIILCNLKGMEMKLYQSPVRGYHMYAMKAPLWPTPIRSPIHALA